MRTLKVIDGDFVFDEQGELEMVEDQEETEQGMEMLLKIRLDEFMLDETIGLKRDNVLTKRLGENEAYSDILESLMPLTEEGFITEISDITFNINKADRSLNVDLTAVRNDGTKVSVKGVDMNGT
ncbi:DUF2634 domain-containing protein [Metabacillus fastidiosus]|uniref:DUF2634 domain-containing protein n=1 Tax=Metabacillus fastidiosus TaxID=1458 RepID=UPI002E1B47F8|nr:DUF2634 domain-containing protein [Metabacillus fastidiosus]